MSDALFPSNPELETVPVKAEHLTEGMIVHMDNGCVFTVADTHQHYNTWGADEIAVFSTTDNAVWLSVGETVEVEA